MVGNYHASFYVINGMVLETRKRREHLSSDDLKKNKALLENFAKGNAEYLEQQGGNLIKVWQKLTFSFLRNIFVPVEFPRKESLAPPPPSKISWDDYVNSSECPILGRTPICKDSSKTFRATIAMSEDFPLTIEMLLSVLEVTQSFQMTFHELFDKNRHEL